MAKLQQQDSSVFDNCLKIPFSFNEASIHKHVKGLESKAIIASLLESGFEFIDLIDLPCEYSDLCNPKNHGVTLFTESDAEFLAMAYQELEGLVENKTFGKHCAFLNDGGLEIMGLLSKEKVELEINRYPGLNINLRSTYKAIVSLSAYLDTWRGMANVLLKIQEASKFGADKIN